MLILFLNSGISPGSETLAESGEPLNDGLKTIFGGYGFTEREELRPGPSPASGS